MGGRVQKIVLSFSLPACIALLLQVIPAAGSATIGTELELLLKTVKPDSEIAVIISFSKTVDVRREQTQELIRQRGGKQIAVLWIINSIAARVPSRMIAHIAALDGVINIRSDKTITVPQH